MTKEALELNQAKLNEIMKDFKKTLSDNGFTVKIYTYTTNDMKRQVCLVDLHTGQTSIDIDITTP